MCALASDASRLSSRTLCGYDRLVRLVSIGGGTVSQQCMHSFISRCHGSVEAYRVESKDQKCVRWLQTHHVCLAELCVGMIGWFAWFQLVVEQCLNNVCTVSCHGVCGSIAR